MTTTGLASPARATRPRIPVDPPTPPPSRSQPPRRRSFERILTWSVAISILLHLLVLLLSPLFIEVGVPPGATNAVPTQPRPTPGLEALSVIESANAPALPQIEQDALPEPARPETPPRRSEAVPANPAPSSVPPTLGSGDQTRSRSRDALRPGYRDSRLYVTPDEYPELSKTEHEVYMEHLSSRIDALNDSMAVASARNRTTSDWTYTDADGDKWGLSGDGLHLGGITIPRAILPLPGATGDNQRIEEDRERQRQREEIQRQEDDRQRRATQNERTRATREANDEARRNGGS